MSIQPRAAVRRLVALLVLTASCRAPSPDASAARSTPAASPAASPGEAASEPAPASSSASAASGELSPQLVTYTSGSLTLHGFLYRPPGPGPFPAIVFNHGSEPLP